MDASWVWGPSGPFCFWTCVRFFPFVSPCPCYPPFPHPPPTTLSLAPSLTGVFRFSSRSALSLISGEVGTKLSANCASVEDLYKLLDVMTITITQTGNSALDFF